MSEKREERDPTVARTYTLLVSQLDAGDVERELTEKLAELNERLSERSLEDGKAVGELTLKLKFACSKGVVQITPDVSCKAPKKHRPVITYFQNQDLQLTLRNPKQGNLFPKEVPARDDSPPREAPAR